MTTASCFVLFSGCRGATVPNQVLTAPTPARAAAPTAVAGPWAFRLPSTRQTLALDQSALITIRGDTSVHSDTIGSHAELEFTVQPASGVSGVVSAFLVAAPVHPPATPGGVVVPFPFRGTFPASGEQLVVTAPRDTVPCSSSARAVTESLRDLWFRPPDTLRIGTSWEDSTTYVVCRDGIPIRTAAHRTFRVTGSAMHNDHVVLQISRTSRTTVEGSGTQFGDPVQVNGAGSGLLDYVVDPFSGEIVSATGSATLDFSMRSSIRTQVVRQVAEIRISRN